MFIQAGRVALVLRSRDKLARSSGLSDYQMSGFSGVVLAHNVRPEAGVDAVIAETEAS